MANKLAGRITALEVKCELKRAVTPKFSANLKVALDYFKSQGFNPHVLPHVNMTKGERAALAGLAWLEANI